MKILAGTPLLAFLALFTQFNVSAHKLQQPFGSEITIANEHSAIESGTFGTGRVRFDGHKVLAIDVQNKDDLDRVASLVEAYNLDAWTPLRLGTVQLRVPPALLPLVTPQLPPHRTIHPDVQQLIDSVPISIRDDPDDPDDPEDPQEFFRSYHTYDEITNFTFGIATRFPDIATVFSVGKTYEGKEIWGVRLFGGNVNDGVSVDEGEEDENDVFERLRQGLGEILEEGGNVLQDVTEGGEDLLDQLLKKIGLDGLEGLKETYKKSNNPQKPPHTGPMGIVLHGGQHAREWISVAVLTYIMESLATGYGVNARFTHLLNQFEWSLIPVMNVDGYIYTHEHNRMWRKNRQPTSFPWCVGTDTNRNWGYKWNNGGSSSNPCSESYMGPVAFSTPEAKAMADYVIERTNVIAYIDFHSFSQLWMTPFGGDCEEKPKDNENILELALGSAKALMHVHGKRFEVGPVCEIIYQASGGSLDWTYAVARVKYSYGVELRDTGANGFILPPEEILPSGEEIMSAVVYMAQFIEMREMK